MAGLRQEEEVAQVIRRASEIEEQSKHLTPSDQDIQELLRAADEIGLSREATLQAIRERMTYTKEAFKEGQLVFAKSGDGRLYPARLMTIDGEGAQVKFTNGGDGRVALPNLRPFSLGPGEKLEYNSPSMYTWVTGEIVRSNLDGGSVTVSCWGIEETVPLDRIRLPIEQVPSARAKAEILAVGLTTGTVGFLLGIVAHWLMRR